MNDEKKQLIVTYVIYSVIFAFFLFKMFFYYNEINKTPDMYAQISYVIYLEQNQDKLIPDYENIKMYSFWDVYKENNHEIWEMREKNTTCYLGHPPFYYKFMQVCGVVELNKNGVFIDITKISYINICFTAMTMLLILYIGFTQLSKTNANVVIHYMYAVICTSLPLYSYVGSGINNDNWCNIGLVIFFAGVLVYLEKGYSGLAYFEIAFGIMICIFSKLTAALVILLACIVIVLLDCLKNKSLKIIFNKYFAMTLPIYSLILGYFMIIYSRYGTFQPSYSKFVSEEEFRNSSYYVEAADRVSMTFAENCHHFFRELMRTWTSTYHSSYTVDREGILLVPFVLVLILFVVQAGAAIYKYIKYKQMQREIYTFAFLIGICLTIAVHFKRHRSAYLSVGYLGGYQARYYMPCLPVIGLGVSQLADRIYTEISGVRKCITNIAIIVFSGIMIYADFFYFILMYYKIM